MHVGFSDAQTEIPVLGFCFRAIAPFSVLGVGFALPSPASRISPIRHPHACWLANPRYSIYSFGSEQGRGYADESTGQVPYLASSAYSTPGGQVRFLGLGCELQLWLGTHHTRPPPRRDIGHTYPMGCIPFPCPGKRLLSFFLFPNNHAPPARLGS